MNDGRRQIAGQKKGFTHVEVLRQQVQSSLLVERGIVGPAVLGEQRIEADAGVKHRIQLPVDRPFVQLGGLRRRVPLDFSATRVEV